MPTPGNPAPGSRESLFPTPELSDLVFWEWRDDTGPQRITASLDDYGQAHPNTASFPNHEVVYISEKNEKGQRRWVYAAPRIDQWRYNKEITYPYNGRKRFPRVTRTTFEKRTEYEAALAETPPATPVSNADPEAETNAAFADAVLASETQSRVPDQELDSLYVLVTRTYDTIPDLTEADDIAELIKFGYRISYPFADEDYPRVTWTFPIALSAYAHVDLGTACPITSGEDYSALKLTDQQVAPGEGANIGNITRVYDTFPGPTLDTVSKKIEHGIPAKFIVSSTITKEETRKETGASPTTPSGDPVATPNSVIESAVGPEGESHFIDRLVDYKATIVTGTTTDERIDPDTGGLVTTTETVVASPGTGVAVASDGTFTEVRQLSQTKDLEIASVVSGLAGGNDVTWYTFEEIYWPAVLESLFFAPIEKFVRPFVRGATYDAGIYTDYEVKEEGVYSTRVNWTKSWTKTQPAEAVTVLVPRPINFRFRRFGMNIRPTLHPEQTFFENIGSKDPVYPTGGLSKTFAATTYTDWPADRIVHYDVKPEFGGFKILKGVAVTPTP